MGESLPRSSSDPLSETSRNVPIDSGLGWIGRLTEERDRLFEENHRHKDALHIVAAERDRLRNALTGIAVGEIPGQYDHDLSAYAHDVLKGGGDLQEFPGDHLRDTKS